MLFLDVHRHAKKTLTNAMIQRAVPKIYAIIAKNARAELTLVQFFDPTRLKIFNGVARGVYRSHETTNRQCGQVRITSGQKRSGLFAARFASACVAPTMKTKAITGTLTKHYADCLPIQRSSAALVLCD